MGSISPVNGEPRECAALRRNIRRFARERADERARADRARVEVERRRREWQAAQRRLYTLKQRAKAQDRRPGREGDQIAKKTAEMSRFSTAPSFFRGSPKRCLAITQLGRAKLNSSIERPKNVTKTQNADGAKRIAISCFRINASHNSDAGARR